jgi:hypothetical protein
MKRASRHRTPGARVASTPGLRRGHEDLAAGGEATRSPEGDRCADVTYLHRVLDPLLAELVEIGDEPDRQVPVRARRRVEEAQIGPALVDDASGGV